MTALLVLTCLSRKFEEGKLSLSLDLIGERLAVRRVSLALVLASQFEWRVCPGLMRSTPNSVENSGKSIDWSSSAGSFLFG